MRESAPRSPFFLERRRSVRPSQSSCIKGELGRGARNPGYPVKTESQRCARRRDAWYSTTTVGNFLKGHGKGSSKICISKKKGGGKKRNSRWNHVGSSCAPFDTGPVSFCQGGGWMDRACVRACVRRQLHLGLLSRSSMEVTGGHSEHLFRAGSRATFEKRPSHDPQLCWLHCVRNALVWSLRIMRAHHDAQPDIPENS